MLLAQEGLDLRRLARDFVASRRQVRPRGVFLPGLREYLRRGFHPKDKDIDGLAAEYLASAGLS
jgi:predicted metal-dependent hydrolase